MLPHWHPEQYKKRKPFLDSRRKVVDSIRAYFSSQDFSEVDTPALQISPGNETHLQAFKTELRDPHGGEPKTLYLHTSPEFAMKKLLVAGETRIYQMAHAFRNAERSSRHHPEFIMLEWYRANEDILSIMEDCVNLVRAAANAAEKKTFAANGMSCDPFQEWERITVSEAFDKYAGIDILATAADARNPEPSVLKARANDLGIRTAEDDSWEDIFFRIMAEKIEPHLGNGRPAFLCDYPVSMAALARQKPEDPRLAERFELYMAGYEIANAFAELTDAEEQLRRFNADMDLKEKLYGERFPIDMNFIDALRHGMPPCSGIALGLDRLVMLCAGTENIEDVQWINVDSFQI